MLICDELSSHTDLIQNYPYKQIHRYKQTLAVRTHMTLQTNNTHTQLIRHCTHHSLSSYETTDKQHIFLANTTLYTALTQLI